MGNKPFVIIAMDGGAASGKSTTSRALAKRFHLMHVDTGGYYRALTWYLLQNNVDLSLGNKVTAFFDGMELGTSIEGETAHISFNGEVVPDSVLRTPEVNARVSTVAAIPRIRQYLFDFQREQKHIAREAGFNGLVMEGRDIGTAIFPEADFRFFLEADIETRVQRRAAEGKVDHIVKRDHVDSTRAASPTNCPEGAIRIDTSHLGFEEVVDKVCEIINGALCPAGESRS